MYGWTPEQIGELTLAQVYGYLTSETTDSYGAALARAMTARQARRQFSQHAAKVLRNGN